MKKYSCIVEGKTFKTQEEVLEHILSEHEDLTGGSNGEAFIEVLQIGEESLSETEEKTEETVEETSEESPSEVDAVDEQTLKDVTGYKDLSDPEKGELLQTLFGTKKKVREVIRVGHLSEDYSKRIAQMTIDGRCFICDEHWSRLHIGPTNISPQGKGSDKKLDSTPGPRRMPKGDELPLIIIKHIKAKHPKVWDTLKALFEIPKKPRSIVPAPNPEGSVDMPRHVTNPSKIVGRGDLSREDLSSILDDKKFIEKLSKKTEKGFEMSPEERKRLLKVWMSSKTKR